MKFKDLGLNKLFVYINGVSKLAVYCKTSSNTAVGVIKLKECNLEWGYNYNITPDEEIEEVHPTNVNGFNLHSYLRFKDLNKGDVFRYNVGNPINPVVLICMKTEDNKAVYINGSYKGEYTSNFVFDSTPVIKLVTNIEAKDMG